MKQPPFSYNEAKNICADHQHLIGLSYSKDSTCKVNAVVITPHNEVCKNRFIMLFLLLNDADKALNQDYNGSQYDVTVISCLFPGSGLKHTTLHEWIAANEDVLEMANGSHACVKSA